MLKINLTGALKIESLALILNDMYTIGILAQITNGEVIGDSKIAIDAFITDSRQHIYSTNMMFVALVTKRNNAHKFIPSLLPKLNCFLVSERPQVKEAQATYLLVKDTLLALQEIAAHHRRQFQIPVIGITGSNGKTIVKEWLFQLLQDKETICRSPKSYNSQLGVPLSVLKLENQHTLGIFEAGISLPDEMLKLERVIHPNIGVFTNLGDAHSEGFRSDAHKLEEKLKLFTACDKVIMNGVEEGLIPDTFRKKSILIGTTDKADVQLRFEITGTQTQISLIFKRGDAFAFTLPFTDKASISNAATCAVTLLSMGYDKVFLNERFNALQALELRLEVKNGINESLIINDFYNSDLDSIQIALDFLRQQHRKQKTIAVISDVDQSAKSKEELYRQLQYLLSQAGVEMLIGIGQDISKHADLFSKEDLFFENTSDFILNYTKHKTLFRDATILLKGARRFGFERISNLLQLKSHDTVLEINLNHLADNVNYYRSLIEPPTKLMCMVKATAYGSGSTEIATTLQHMGVDYLAVAYADEGVELRAANIRLPIMVMSPEKDAWADIVQYQLEPEVYSFEVLEQLLAYLHQHQQTEAFPIHIKVDTGMKRLGFELEELPQLLKLLKAHPAIKVQSVFSHLVASDNQAHDAFTKHQIGSFLYFANGIEEALGYKVMRHICNSGGISRFRQAHFDMVRLGIGMYGVGVSAQEQSRLKNVSRLRTTISQIKHVKAGETIGYNRNGQAEKGKKIATIPLGYADGFHRMLGNGKHLVYISGKPCATIGNICMDMCMVDVTGLDVNPGDEVVIFESYPQLQKLAEAMQTIPYEVLTGISARVKRVYIQE